MHERVLQTKPNCSLLCPRCFKYVDTIIILNDRRFCVECAETEPEKEIAEEFKHRPYGKVHWQLEQPKCPLCDGQWLKKLGENEYYCLTCEKPFTVEESRG